MINAKDSLHGTKALLGDMKYPIAFETGYDQDGDGIPDETDNCPEWPNPDQIDNDGKHDKKDKHAKNKDKK